MSELANKAAALAWRATGALTWRDAHALAWSALALALLALVAATGEWVWFAPGRSRAIARSAAVARLVGSADRRLRLAAVEQAALLRSGELSSVELVDLSVAQLEAVDRELNLLVGERFSAARLEARAADAALSRARRAGPAALAQLPPLLGVPMITKEVHAYPGFPYTMGLVRLAGRVAALKNPALARLERAGAIVLACGNTSEACMWAESANYVHGVSSNPYDASRTVGGSSGGTAAAAAALGGAFAVTSDVGGSTRIPSLYCGMFGHKPSGGAIPNCRSIPVVHGKVERFCQLGPCARSARDLFPLLRLMAGPSRTDELVGAEDAELRRHAEQRPWMREFAWPEPRAADVQRLRLFVVWEQPGAEFGLVSPRHAAMVAAQARAVAALERRTGRAVERVRLDKMDRCFDIWGAALQTANPVAFAKVISEGKPREVSPVMELAKWLLTGGHGSDHTLPAIALALTENLAKLTPQRNKELDKLNSALRDEINALLGNDGVLLFPSLPTPAPTHGPLPNLLRFADYAACGIFNTLELPATAVPMGLSDEGLPTGLQIVAANGCDHLTIATALALEEDGAARWEPPRFVVTA